MSRLRHSFAGYLREMQISQKEVFVFIESPILDRYIYSRIAESECGEKGCEVVAAEELPGSTGGKPGLLDFFDYLKRRKSLISDFDGKVTLSIFCLDKDVDDHKRKMRRSKHVIYTEVYEVENYLYMHGKVCEAIAASGSVEMGLIKAHITNENSWRKHAAESWKEWVKLCLYAHGRGVGSVCNYGNPYSAINNGTYGLVNQSEYDNIIAELQIHSGLTKEKFEKSFGRISRKVDKLYNLDEYDKVFKGKWYACFAEEDVRMIMRGRRWRRRASFREILTTTLCQSLDFNGAWTAYFRKPLRELLVLAGL